MELESSSTTNEPNDDNIPTSADHLYSSHDTNTSSSLTTHRISLLAPSHHVEQIIIWLQDMLPIPEPIQKWFIIFLLGKRRIGKAPILPSQLTTTETNIWNYIQDAYSHQARKERVIAFMKNRKISKRLISYFIVHYVAIHPTCYYLDRHTYPYQIVSPIGSSMNHIPYPSHIPPDHPVLFINIFVEYHKCLYFHVPQKCNAPYSRKNIVKDQITNEEYSLNAIPYYIWLDSIGAIDAFYQLQDTVKKAKKEYEATKHRLKSSNQKLSLKELCKKGYDEPTNRDTVVRRAFFHPYIPKIILHKKNAT